MLFTFSLNFVIAQWNQSTGLQGINCQRFAKLGNTVFVGADGAGIWKSTNDGLSWIQCNNGLNASTDYSITELAVLGNNTIVAATYDNGLFKSIDYGANWVSITGNLPASKIYPITALAANETTIIVGIDSQGIYYTTDSGSTWTLANSGWTTNMFYRQLCIVGTDVFACSQDGVFKSSISSFLWSPVINGLPGTPPSIRRIYNDNDTLYLGTSSNGIYRSVDHAANWTSLNTSLTQGFRVSSIIEKNDTLYFASNGSTNNVYMSPKVNINWNTVGSGLASSPNDIIFSNNNLLAATGVNGPYYFNTLGTTLTADNNKIQTQSSINIFPNPFSSQITIRFPQLQENTKIVLMDLKGNILKSINFSGIELTMEKEELTKGLYYLQIISQINEVICQKILLE
jgi:photosystem II stability/assembly factor-like uncharacterized protein